MLRADEFDLVEVGDGAGVEAEGDVVAGSELVYEPAEAGGFV